MAGIDKIYCNKEAALSLWDYFLSIDDDFKKIFPNCPSIFNYIYIHSREDIENIPDDSGKEFPLTNFPTLVDKWLYQREDCHEYIRNYLTEFQYKSSVDELLEPLHIPQHNTTTKSKITILQRTGALAHANFPLSHFNIYSAYFKGKNGERYPYWYYDEIDKWRTHLTEDRNNVELVGLGCSSSAHHPKIKSFKALLRKIQSYNFPKGTYVEVIDWRYVGHILLYIH